MTNLTLRLPARLAALLATFLSAVTFAANPDPLFGHMEGRWIGHGKRLQLAANHAITGEVAIEVRVESRVVDTSAGPRLESRNAFHETRQDGATRDYAKTYWLQSEKVSGRYLLGADGAATVEGTLEGDTFSVNQELGGNPPLSVDSLTRFEDGISHYRAQMHQGERVFSETRIEYARDARD